MSYDLFFRFRPGALHASASEILDFFKSRPGYECSETQAWYSNETTGVYFSFEIEERGTAEEAGEQFDEEAPPPDPDAAPVSFNINYYRPHFFGLEAEPELTLFVKLFDLLVSDPQVSGMGDGEYTPEGFLAGWNAGNVVGYRAAAASIEDEKPHLLPTAVLERIWRWNYTRPNRAEALGDETYVPRIFHFQKDGQLQSGIVWGDAMPILIPRVDLILAPREKLAPRRFFKAQEDKVLCTWGEIEPLLTTFPQVNDYLPAWRLSYREIPRAIEAFFRSHEPLLDTSAGMKIVAMDLVLNAEIYEEARKPRT